MKKIVLNETQYKRLKNIIIERSILNEQSKDQVMQIQQMLKDRFNADLGKSGPNKDGVDGIVGDRTKNAIEKFTEYRFEKSEPENDEKQTDDQNSSLNDLIA
jgi:hypothetical protein